MRYDSSYLEQLLSETIDASKAYTVRVDVAQANDAWGGGSGAELYAWNGSTATRIAFVRYSSANQWGTLSLQAAGAELAPYAGQQLGVRLRGGNADRTHFDNVRVDRIDVPATFQAASNLTVPDFSFETSGAVNGSWAGGSGIWNGAGWPMNSGSYGQNATVGSRVGVQSTYQLLTDTFVEGARYTLTVDASLRGDQGANPIDYTKIDSSGLMFFSEDQYPGAGTAHFSPSLGTLDGSMSTAMNPNGIGAGDWVTISLTYVATADDAGQRIGLFLGAGDPRIGAAQTVWDNVRLTVELAEAEAVPEPSTYALGLVGLVSLGCVALRKKVIRRS